MSCSSFFSEHQRTSRDLRLGALWTAGTVVYGAGYLLFSWACKLFLNSYRTHETLMGATNALTVIRSECGKLGAEFECMRDIRFAIKAINLVSWALNFFGDYYDTFSKELGVATSYTITVGAAVIGVGMMLTGFLCIIPTVLHRLYSATKKYFTILEAEPNRNSKKILSCCNIMSFCASVLTFSLLFLTPVLYTILALTNYRDAISSVIATIDHNTAFAYEECRYNKPCMRLLEEFNNNTNSLASIPNASPFAQLALPMILPAIAFLIMGTGICIKLFQSYRKDTSYRAPYAGLN